MYKEKMTYKTVVSLYVIFNIKFLSEGQI